MKENMFCLTRHSNTFHFALYGFGFMIKYNTDYEREEARRLYRFPRDRTSHTTIFVKPDVENW